MSKIKGLSSNSSWEENVEKNNLICNFSNDRMSVIYIVCFKEVKSCRPPKNERWKDCTIKISHSTKITSSTQQCKITEVFLPLSLSKYPLPAMTAHRKITHFPKICPRIHPGNENLMLMKSYEKYGDSNTRAISDTNGEKEK